MIHTLAFAGYRSLREVRLGVGRMTVVTGANATGKSNVYRALRLLADAADGQLGLAIAREGGMRSAMTAGERPSKAKQGEGLRLSIGFADAALAYELRLGLPAAPGAFPLDPEVKEETIRTISRPKVVLLERRNVSAWVRDKEGNRDTYGAQIDINESVLSQITEPHRHPVLSGMRERIRRWRFYHQIRTDQDSPVRTSQVGTRTPVLSHDGRDLAAALLTIEEVGDCHALDGAVAEAFSGARIRISSEGATFQLQLDTPGTYRPLTAAELSDGTLRYLALLAALYTPRPPELLVFNEPETSLHPSLLEPLAKQIVSASTRSQVIVVSHAAPLVEAIANHRDAMRIELIKEEGETKVANRNRLDEPPWKWTT